MPVGFNIILRVPKLTPYIFAARLVLTYYRHKKELDAALENDNSFNRQSFFKILALGLFDAILTLPIIIMNLVAEISQNEVDGFWQNWNSIHEFLTFIPTVTAEEWKSAGFWTVFPFRFNQWINVVMAIAFFVLFGLTEERRAWYRGLFLAIMRPLGLKHRSEVEVSSIILFGSGPMINPQLMAGQPTTMCVTSGRILTSVFIKF